MSCSANAWSIPTCTAPRLPTTSAMVLALISVVTDLTVRDATLLSTVSRAVAW